MGHLVVSHPSLKNEFVLTTWLPWLVCSSARTTNSSRSQYVHSSYRPCFHWTKSPSLLRSRLMHCPPPQTSWLRLVCAPCFWRPGLGSRGALTDMPQPELNLASIVLSGRTVWSTSWSVRQWTQSRLLPNICTTPLGPVRREYWIVRPPLCFGTRSSLTMDTYSRLTRWFPLPFLYSLSPIDSSF